MNAKLPAIERPNGKPYRPRKISCVTLGNEDELLAILVFGTHDVEVARTVAMEELERVRDEFYGPWMNLVITDKGEPVWRGERLSHFDEYGKPVYDYTYDPDAGRAAVRFTVDEQEVIAA